MRGAVGKRVISELSQANMQSDMRPLTKFEREKHWVSQLALRIGLPMNDVSDPLLICEREIGVDVIVTRGRRRLGIQVTEIDGSEGISREHKGRLRATEKSKQRANSVFGMYVGNSPHMAVAGRIRAKVEKSKRYTFSEVDEVWLLVVANLPDVPASTFVPRNSINLDVLTRISGAELTGSKYQRAFYQQIMFPALFEWTPGCGWLTRT
jgi:hypothetical protein